MKQNKLNKKLMLNKNTISSLQMRHTLGGLVCDGGCDCGCTCCCPPPPTPAPGCTYLTCHTRCDCPTVRAVTCDPVITKCGRID